MKRFLLSLVIALSAITATFGQVFMAAPERIKPAPAEGEDQEWIQLCNPSAETSGGVGTQSVGLKIGAGVMFGTDFLANYNGKSISVIAVCLYTPLTEVTVEAIKGEDINKGTVMASTKVGMLAAGWNYIKLDTPVSIDGTEPISIVYKSLDTAQFPLLFDGNKNAPKGSSYLSTNGDDFAEDLQFGAVMIRAFIGEDYNKLANSVYVGNIDGTKYAESGKATELELELVNNSFNEVSSLTLDADCNGAKTTQEIKLETPLKSNSSASYKFTTGQMTENTTYSFSISKVNGEENASAATTANVAITVYTPGTEVKRTILIEKFTGQACGYCPGGEQKITAAIKGQEDHVARIDHHAGYYDDLFTITESKRIAQYFGVASAPNCMIDRTPQENTSSTNSVVWSPYNMTPEIVAKAVNKPAFISIEITSSFNAQTKELSVNVKGKSGLNGMQNKKINVVLTQSGYTANQSSGGLNYVHNDFPIVFLTAFSGDAITADSEGNYDMNFTCTIKDLYTSSYGTRKVDFTKLKLVAFISDWGNSEASEVYNAATTAVEAENSISDAEEADVRFYAADSRIAAEGNCTEMTVYDVTGAQVENKNLNGLYIVKAVVDGKTYTQKVVVR